MSFIFNGTTINDVYFNGTKVGDVYFNGVKVLASQTAAPTINTPTYNAIKKEWSWTVTNNDNNTATIYCDVGTNPPTTSRGDIVSGGSVTVKQSDPTGAGGFTIYAKAQASGKAVSDVVSVSV